MLSREVQDKVIELLAIVYAKVPWHQMRTSKNPHDIFNHRVRAAARAVSLEHFISKLCNYFGLQSLPSEVIPYLQELKQYEDAILNALYMEHIAYCGLAILKAKEIKNVKKKTNAANLGEALKNLKTQEKPVSLFGGGKDA